MRACCAANIDVIVAIMRRHNDAKLQQRARDRARVRGHVHQPVHRMIAAVARDAPIAPVAAVPIHRDVRNGDPFLNRREEIEYMEHALANIDHQNVPYGPPDRPDIIDDGLLRPLRRFGRALMLDRDFIDFDNDADYNFHNDMLLIGPHAKRSVDPSKDEKYAVVKGELECSVCYENKRAIAIQPCGHFYMCHSCFKRASKCAMCEGPVRDYLVVIVS